MYVSELIEKLKQLEENYTLAITSGDKLLDLDDLTL